MAKGKKKKKEEKHDQEDGDIKSDPETLNTTDPQEHMKGPISSLMKEIGEGFDDKDAEKKPTGK
jgi:hypothetical protein